MNQVSVLSDLLQVIGDRSRLLIERRRPRRTTSAEIGELCEEVLSGRGEASGVARAQEVLEAYGGLDSAGRTGFFRTLMTRFGVDEGALKNATERYLKAPGEASARDVARAAQPRRVRLLRRLNEAPGGTRVLVDMRRDLLERLKAAPELRPVDEDFFDLFASWFNRGFLLLRRIDWQTSASILAKIIHYEAVHAIRDWEDLRRRIDLPDRRLYAFFHPRLGDDPIIFVEVALTTEIPASIAAILDRDRTPIAAEEATTAVFYSISNCQPGLRGISFGSFLIKQVAEDLRSELRQLRTFVTLSPVPGFADWLADLKAETAADGPALDEATRGALEALSTPAWWKDGEGSEKLSRHVMPLAAWYLARGKARDGRPRDPVARFHLGNGARLERINWAADLSERGLSKAHGVMVNYLYDLSDIEKNHEAFTNEGQVVASSAVNRLVRQLREPKAPKEVEPAS